MGAPVGPFEAGDTCHACAPKLWKEGKTPKYIRVCFRDIVKCNPENPDVPNGHPFLLQQHVSNSCLWIDWWTIGIHDWTVEVAVNKFYYPDYRVSEIRLECAEFVSPCVFLWIDNEKCQIENGSKKENMRSCEAGNWYEGGTATVWWQPDEIPLTLTEAYGFHPGKENLHDRLYLPDDKQCIKIANKSDKTNVLFSVDETQF